MRKYIYTVLLSCLTFTLTVANQAIEIVQMNDNQTVTGKYKEYKEIREIIRNGKVINKQVYDSNEDGVVYNFKSKDLVTRFSPDMDGKIRGINFRITRNKNKYELINNKGEAEDDELILKKNSFEEIIFVRMLEDGDEEGKLFVRCTIYLKRIL